MSRYVNPYRSRQRSMGISQAMNFCRPLARRRLIRYGLSMVGNELTISSGPEPLKTRMPFTVITPSAWCIPPSGLPGEGSARTVKRRRCG